MKKSLLILALAATVSFSALTDYANAGDGDRTRLRARLANVGANPAAQGKADWEFRTEDGRTKMDVEGRNMSADFSSVDVYLNGVYLASATVFAGSFDVDIDTDEGDTVPMVDVGDLIEVFDSDTADLLFVGEFSDRRRDPGAGGGGGGQQVELFVQMTNIGANPLASADAKHRTIGTRLTFDVEGEDLSADFTSVDIYAAGNYIATEAVDQLGRFSLDIDTFEGDTNVPALVEGDVVEVFNSANGSIMFSGTLQLEK